MDCRSLTISRLVLGNAEVELLPVVGRAGLACFEVEILAAVTAYVEVAVRIVIAIAMTVVIAVMRLVETVFVSTSLSCGCASKNAKSNGCCSEDTGIHV